MSDDMPNTLEGFIALYRAGLLRDVCFDVEKGPERTIVIVARATLVTEIRKVTIEGTVSL